MIRYTKYLNKDYVIIDGSLEIDDMAIPIQYQVNIDKVKEEDRSKVFRILSTAFNRNISFDKPKPQSKKSWWRVW
jgi:hypothetical protein